ncbi:MAG: hypothetical protein AAFV80_05420, partial [Bacteroidota bacterium]
LKYLFFFLIGLPLSSFAQSQIELKNASFEGQMIKAATTPEYWSACGLYSSPDVQPGHWGVDNKPQDGSSFIGLITRDDNTWEIIAQELSEPLIANECYQFSAHLAQSPSYAGYNNQPVRFRIWGGYQLCEKVEMLGQTVPITHYNWKVYDFVVVPEHNYNFIIVEAYYMKDNMVPYRGNLLIDNLSAFRSCERASIE